MKDPQAAGREFFFIFFFIFYFFNFQGFFCLEATFEVCLLLILDLTKCHKMIYKYFNTFLK